MSDDENSPVSPDGRRGDVGVEALEHELRALFAPVAAPHDFRERLKADLLGGNERLVLVGALGARRHLRSPHRLWTTVRAIGDHPLAAAGLAVAAAIVLALALNAAYFGRPGYPNALPENNPPTTRPARPTPAPPTPTIPPPATATARLAPPTATPPSAPAIARPTAAPTRAVNTVIVMATAQATATATATARGSGEDVTPVETATPVATTTNGPVPDQSAPSATPTGGATETVTATVLTPPIAATQTSVVVRPASPTALPATATTIAPKTATATTIAPKTTTAAPTSTWPSVIPAPTMSKVVPVSTARPAPARPTRTSGSAPARTIVAVAQPTASPRPMVALPTATARPTARPRHVNTRPLITPSATATPRPSATVRRVTPTTVPIVTATPDPTATAPRPSATATTTSTPTASPIPTATATPFHNVLVPSSRLSFPVPYAGNAILGSPLRNALTPDLTAGAISYTVPASWTLPQFMPSLPVYPIARMPVTDTDVLDIVRQLGARDPRDIAPQPDGQITALIQLDNAPYTLTVYPGYGAPWFRLQAVASEPGTLSSVRLNAQAAGWLQEHNLQRADMRLLSITDGAVTYGQSVGGATLLGPSVLSLSFDSRGALRELTDEYIVPRQPVQSPAQSSNAAASGVVVRGEGLYTGPLTSTVTGPALIDSLTISYVGVSGGVKSDYIEPVYVLGGTVPTTSGPQPFSLYTTALASPDGETPQP